MIRTVILRSINPASNELETIGYLYFNSDTEKYCLDQQGLIPVSSIAPPEEAGHSFEGYYYGASTLAIEPSGQFADVMLAYVPPADFVLEARWTRLYRTISLDNTGGGGTVSEIYYRIVGGGLFADKGFTAPISSITPPSRECYALTGFYLGMTKGIDADGTFTSALVGWSVPADSTLVAQWVKISHAISFDNGDGVSQIDSIYFKINRTGSELSNWFMDSACTPGNEWSGFALSEMPSRQGYLFKGYYSGETIEIDDTGSVTQSFTSWIPSDDGMLTARWQKEYVRIALDPDGGVGDGTEIWSNAASGIKYEDELGEEQITFSYDALPTRAGYSFAGYYYGDILAIGSDGALSAAFIAWKPASEASIVARWTPNTYTITFDYNVGSGDVSNQLVVFGSAVGPLPSGTSAQGNLIGWYYGDLKVVPTTIYTVPNGVTLVARWGSYFGKVNDWFGLETENGPLMLVASNSGATRTVVETSHTGVVAIQSSASSVGAFRTYGILMNPVCTYRIRKKGNVTISLGSAWAGSGTLQSGYMLVNAEYSTAADSEPVLVVRGAANEGAAAINRWSVNLAVSPDHIAQDPMAAVSGGGEMTECRTLITCEAVVPMENGMPCASDIVHGKVVVTATTNAYRDENAPTANSPFIETNGVTPDESDIDFCSYALKAERAL